MTSRELVMSKATDLIRELREVFKKLILSLHELAKRAGDKGGKRLDNLRDGADIILRWIFPDGSVLKAEIFTRDCLSHNHMLAVETD